jgi:hypothetical protein
LFPISRNSGLEGNDDSRPSRLRIPAKPHIYRYPKERRAEEPEVKTNGLTHSGQSNSAGVTRFDLGHNEYSNNWIEKALLYSYLRLGKPANAIFG